MSNKEIHSYIYNKKNQPTGVLLAAAPSDGAVVLIGWSLCAVNKGDKFNKQRAIEIARQRSIKGSNVPIPHSIQEKYIHFSTRAAKYFKDKKVVCEISSLSS